MNPAEIVFGLGYNQVAAEIAILPECGGRRYWRVRHGRREFGVDEYKEGEEGEGGKVGSCNPSQFAVFKACYRVRDPLRGALPGMHAVLSTLTDLD